VVAGTTCTRIRKPTKKEALLTKGKDFSNICNILNILLSDFS
jgi:hypothetical protein